MDIKEIKNKEVWENFLLGCKEKTFLDSWNWGEFQKREGEKIWRFGAFNNEELIALALVIKIKAKRGTFLFVPHGPIIKTQNYSSKLKTEILGILLEKLKSLAKEERAIFIRIAPILERNEENAKIFRNLGFKKAPIHIHPEVTWELDINSSEDELLAGMRKTTRYLIRQAEKNADIEIVKSKDIKDLEKFNQIYCATAGRHKFVPFSLNYLENEFSSFLGDGEILIFLGKYKKEIVSSAVIVFWQNIAFYHHGASLSKYNKIPVSYLLQWEAIKEAKKRNCRTYNFWGIAPDIKDKSDIRKSRHPWAGLTLFKMGFGGYRKEYVKTRDFSLSPLYWLTYFFEKMRKIKRGL
jgi:lipid II:glycine glycyltransferase (peptidoglycan interpeptide bridge formation enzyme)